MKSIRYYNSNINKAFRHHFTSIDWIADSANLFHNAYANSSICLKINRQIFFEKNNMILPNFLTKSVYCKFPHTTLSSCKSITFEDNVFLGLIIGKKDWIIVDHVGLIIIENGIKYFVHASSRQGKVVKEELNVYIDSIEDAKLGIFFNIRRKKL